MIPLRKMSGNSQSFIWNELCNEYLWFINKFREAGEIGLSRWREPRKMCHLFDTSKRLMRLERLTQLKRLTRLTLSFRLKTNYKTIPPIHRRSESVASFARMTQISLHKRVSMTKFKFKLLSRHRVCACVCVLNAFCATTGGVDNFRRSHKATGEATT